LKALENCTIYRGHARFVGPHEVQVGEDLLTAERIFINVGGRAVVPTWPSLDQVPYLTNSSMMAVDFLPRHLVIVGGSYVGLEFAQMYRRFGSEVTVVEMGSRLIQREDPDVSAAIQAILEHEGVGIRVDATWIHVGKNGEDIIAGSIVRPAPEIHGSHLLVAAG
jgi:pyruvate/2-oxoglutarate dehydrogenase complex dihydrolipoamide dehydrogenase (E3) component